MKTGIIRTIAAGLMALAFPAVGLAQEPGAPREVRVIEVGPEGWIGITFEPDARDEAVTVTEVMSGGPAERAGIRAGDRLIRWNGRSDVRAAIGERGLLRGDTVQLRLSRSGEEREVAVVAESRAAALAARLRDLSGEVRVYRPGDGARQFRLDNDSLLVNIDSLQARVRVMLRDSLGPRLRGLEDALSEAQIRVLRSEDAINSLRDGGLAIALAGSRSGVAGADLTDLTPGLADYFGAESGALVIRVAPGTPAADAGLQEGDVIVAAGGQAVASVAELRRAFMPRGGDLELRIVRRNAQQTITLPRR